MNTRHRLGVAAGLVAVAALVSVLAAPSLPERMVTHWNAAGEPDATMAKPVALALFPGLMAGLLLLLAFAPQFDPRQENIEAFRPAYDWFVVVFTALLFVIHAGVIAYNLGFRFDFTLLVLAGVAGLLYYVGMLLEQAEPNWFVGIRTPWTLESETVWRRTHDLGARLLKLTALIALGGLAFGEYAIYFLLVPTLATAVITVGYFYYLYQTFEE